MISKEYESLTAPQRLLIDRCIEAQNLAYAPYSRQI